ncbi:MAG TPA: FAD-binding oxidoreductase, partial [Candidatus Binataceae bacterium]|nr:FAD-binding oxidoreductase [Candidatus Binataceae bacterium]
GQVSPTVIDLIQKTHLSDQPGNLMLVGRMGPLEEDSTPDPDDYPENADWSVIRQFRDEVWRRIPIMRRSAFRGGYSGINDLSPDATPIVDRVPEVDGLFLACGFSGTGFCFAPAVGQLLAEWALDGAPSIDLATLSLGRFAQPVGDSVISAKSAEPSSY